jgi:fumarylacetoacetase
VSASWVPGADGSGFGIENLPYGVVRPRGGEPTPAVRIGDQVLSLAALAGAGLIDGHDGAFDAPTLNRFLVRGRPAWTATRKRLIELLGAGSDHAARVGELLTPLDTVDALLPIAVGDYVDFYSSIEHASNVGKIFRPEADPLTPNWRHLPIGYHGRASTVVVSGTSIRRPSGQRRPEQPGEPPTFGPERRLDVELELGFVTGPGPARGTPIAARDAADHIFGFVLLNDWSAREIQFWESKPLGPFLAKSFATSISPWVVPLDALAPRRVDAVVQDPPPLDYLQVDEPWALDLDLEIGLIAAGSDDESTIARTNARGLYWNAAQQLAHATVNGAWVGAGDLFGSGTISGSEPGSYGSLLELTWGGRDPLPMRNGTRRFFLEDGDTVVMRGRGGPISLGEVRGRVEPANGEPGG